MTEIILAFCILDLAGGPMNFLLSVPPSVFLSLRPPVTQFPQNLLVVFSSVLHEVKLKEIYRTEGAQFLRKIQVFPKIDKIVQKWAKNDAFSIFLEKVCN